MWGLKEDCATSAPVRLSLVRSLAIAEQSGFLLTVSPAPDVSQPLTKWGWEGCSAAVVNYRWWCVSGWFLVVATFPVTAVTSVQSSSENHFWRFVRNLESRFIWALIKKRNLNTWSCSHVPWDRVRDVPLLLSPPGQTRPLRPVLRWWETRVPRDPCSTWSPGRSVPGTLLGAPRINLMLSDSQLLTFVIILQGVFGNSRR